MLNLAQLSQVTVALFRMSIKIIIFGAAFLKLCIFVIVHLKPNLMAPPPPETRIATILDLLLQSATLPARCYSTVIFGMS